MDSRIALVVNTVSKNKDVWNMFFDRLQKHIPAGFFNKKYVFVDEGDYPDIPEDYEVLFYNSHEMYRDQFVSCVDKVEEEFCIYISEDYILYQDIQDDIIHQFEKVLDTHKDLSFVRFIRGGVIDQLSPKYKSEVCDSLHHLYNYLQEFTITILSCGHIFPQPWLRESGIYQNILTKCNEPLKSIISTQAREDWYKC